MSEYNKFQLSEFFSQQGQVCIRTDDVEEGIEMFETVAKNADRVVDASVQLRNLAKVKGTLPESKPAVTSSGSKSSTPKRKSGSSADLCEHGLPWNDLAGEVGKNGDPYKFRFYCAAKVKDWKDRCKPWGDNEG